MELQGNLNWLNIMPQGLLVPEITSKYLKVPKITEVGR